MVLLVDGGRLERRGTATECRTTSTTAGSPPIAERPRDAFNTLLVHDDHVDLAYVSLSLGGEERVRWTQIDLTTLLGAAYANG